MVATAKRTTLSQGQHVNLAEIIATLLDWQEHGLPDDCFVLLIGESEFLDVSKIKKINLLTYLKNYQEHVRQDGLDG